MTDWLSIWQNEAKPSFHEGQTNRLLEKYWPQVTKQKSINNCFVPLCGKSLDLMFLAHHCQHVYGCELSSIAIESFFNENDIAFTKKHLSNALSSYHGANISLFCGDFFLLPTSVMPKADIIYDRAALIAIKPALRQSYVQKLSQFLETSGQLLLLSMQFNHKQDNIPPFSISNDEIEDLFSAKHHVELLHQQTHQLTQADHLFVRGLTAITHQAHKIR